MGASPPQGGPRGSVLRCFFALQRYIFFLYKYRYRPKICNSELKNAPLGGVLRDGEYIADIVHDEFPVFSIHLLYIFSRRVWRVGELYSQN